MDLDGSYDRVARDYALHLSDELDGKPFDRWILGRVVDLADGGAIVDAGCGTGHITEWLTDRGADVTGVDLSAGMIAEARRRYPDLRFEQGDLHHLPRPERDGGWAAVVAMYSLVHLETADLPDGVEALAAALRPGGHLLVAVHAGTERRHLDEWWDHPVDLDFVFHPPEAVAGAVTAAGLTVVERVVRGPYEGAEAETERAYVLGRAVS